jgi:hypothetical protein
MGTSSVTGELQLYLEQFSEDVHDSTSDLWRKQHTVKKSDLCIQNPGQNWYIYNYNNYGNQPSLYILP